MGKLLLLNSRKDESTKPTHADCKYHKLHPVDSLMLILSAEGPFKKGLLSILHLIFRIIKYTGGTSANVVNHLNELSFSSFTKPKRGGFEVASSVQCSGVDREDPGGRAEKNRA